MSFAELPSTLRALGAARAPGKAFFAGEYGVLVGGPAVLLALDVHARAWLLPPGDAAPGPEDGLCAITERRLRARLTALGHSVPAGQLVAESDAFRAPWGGKLGLGSSAAVAAAGAGAIAAAAGLSLADPALRQVLLEEAIESHRELQGGVGSGADVAASLSGGWIQFRGPYEVQPIVPPPGLAWAICRGRGTAAPSKAFVGRVMAAPARRRDGLLNALAAGGEQLRQQMARGNVESSLAALADTGRLLRRLGEVAALPIWTPVEMELLRRVSRFGVVVKPSGAGGGELTLLAGSSAGALQSAVAQAVELGLVALELPCAPAGLTSEELAPAAPGGEPAP